MPRRAASGAAAAEGGGDAAEPNAAVAQPAAPPPPLALPSPPGLTYDSVVVQPEGDPIGVTVPKFLLPDGRNARRPMVTFVPQRFLEIVLFQRYDGGSSGAVHKIIQNAGIGGAAWTINAAAILNGELSPAHSQFIFETYKELLPTSGDPVLANRTRNVVLLPVSVAASHGWSILETICNVGRVVGPVSWDLPGP